MSYLLTAFRVLLFVVFAASAWSKVRDRSALAELAGTLAAIRLIRSGRAAAIALLIAEAVTAAMLALPWLPSVAAFGAATALLCALSAGVGVVLRQRSRVTCRCFGASRSPLGRWHLVRNLALLGVAAIGLFVNEGTGGHPGGLMIAGSAGALLGALVINAEEIVALFRPSPIVNQKGS